MNLCHLASWGMTTAALCLASLLKPPVTFAASTSLAPAAPNSTPSENQLVFSDDFSNGLTKWQSFRHGEMWSIVNGAAEAYVPYGSTITELVPKDEYWQDDWKNYEFAYDLTPLEGVDRNTLFGFKDSLNWYEIHFVEFMFNIAKLVNGVVPFSDNGNFTLQNGRTYHIVITFNKGRITITIDGQQVYDTTDPTFTDNFGRIGLKAGTGAVYPTRLRYDNVEVRWLKNEAVALSVPSYKQIDSRWATAIYDSATEWSANPTMGRWGCLTTSLAMVLNFHGINVLPNGEQLNPASLNDWLNEQPDGYLGQGLVNWQAISRLTQLTNNLYGTPKLEYLAHLGSSLTTTISEVKNNKPSILQIPGHFLVGLGFTIDESDLLIQDPSFAYQKLSQHQTKLLSTRTLQPSQTDLSYLVVGHAPSLKVTINDQHGEPIATQQLEEQLHDLTDQSGEKTKPWVIQQIAKPVEGTYLISVSQPDFGPFSLQIFAYGQKAQLSILTQHGVVGTISRTYQLQYYHQQPSAIQELVSLQSFEQDAKMLKELNQIWGKFVLNKLAVLSKLAQQAELKPVTAQRYQAFSSVLEGLLKTTSQNMSEWAFLYLQRYLQVQMAVGAAAQT